jgi:hypothetical protein
MVPEHPGSGSGDPAGMLALMPMGSNNWRHRASHRIGQVRRNADQHKFDRRQRLLMKTREVETEYDEPWREPFVVSQFSDSSRRSACNAR